MATIASLAVKLIADPSGAVKGLTVFSRTVQQTGQQAVVASNWINSVAMSMANQAAIGDPFALARAGVSALTTGVQALVGKIPYVGPALSAAAGLIGGAFQVAIDWGQRLYTVVQQTFQEGAEKILAYRASAIQLGASFQEVGALAMAAGGNVERITRAMTHLHSTIYAARTGDAGAIGLLSGKLRLNPEAMAQMTNTERLEAVRKGMAGIGDEMTKNAVELGIFGERAALIFGTLLKGGKSLEEFQKQFHRFGMDLGQTDPGMARAMSDQVLGAKRAWGQVDKAIEGVKMNIAAGLAPVILSISEKFAGVGVDAKKVQEYTVAAAKGMATAGGWVIDAWSGLQKVWYTLKAGFADFAEVVDKGIAAILDTLSDLPEAFGGGAFHQLADNARREATVWHKVAEDARKDFQRIADAPSAQVGINQFFAGVQERIDQLQKDADKLGAPGYQPIMQRPQLAGAAQFGTQEAYKSLGEFASGQSSNMAVKQFEEMKAAKEAIQKSGMTLKDLVRIWKRGLVRTGKI